MKKDTINNGDNLGICGERLMDKLKPCPFCGPDVDWPPHVRRNNVFWTVECKNCAAMCGYKSKAQDAIDAWNHRRADQNGQD